jgi:hypothetical protein
VILFLPLHKPIITRQQSQSSGRTTTECHGSRSVNHGSGSGNGNTGTGNQTINVRELRNHCGISSYGRFGKGKQERRVIGKQCSIFFFFLQHEYLTEVNPFVKQVSVTKTCCSVREVQVESSP